MTITAPMTMMTTTITNPKAPVMPLQRRSNSAPLERLLTICQIVNSSFPTGSFSHSYGMETLIASKRVSDADAIESLCRQWLRYSLCTSDGVAAVHSYRAALCQDMGRIAEIDRRIGAIRLTRETRGASLLTGRAFLAAAAVAIDAPLLTTLQNFVDRTPQGGQHCVMFGAVMALAGVEEDEAVAMLMQSSFVSLVNVAARLMPLGQGQVQEILTRARVLIIDCARLAQSRSLEQMSAAATRLDVASMQHERQQSRLCIS